MGETHFFCVSRGIRIHQDRIVWQQEADMTGESEVRDNMMNCKHQGENELGMAKEVWGFKNSTQFQSCRLQLLIFLSSHSLCDSPQQMSHSSGISNI